MNTKPTAAAMRAALDVRKRCVDDWGKLNVELAAQIIDREFAELVELLAAANKYVPHSAFYGDIKNKPLDEVRLTTRIDTALAKLNTK